MSANPPPLVLTYGESNRRETARIWIEFLAERLPPTGENGTERSCRVGRDLPDSGGPAEIDLASDGLCFVLRLRRNMTRAELADCMVHEWAHALTWDAPGLPHGPRWGEAYARVYRVFYGVE